MRIILALLAVAACGGNHSNSTDATSNGDSHGTVDSPGGGSTNIALTLTNRPNTAATYTFLVAYQDGAGPWTLAPAPTNDTYTFAVSSAVWAAAWTCIPVTPGTNAATREVNLVSFAVAERTSLTMNIPNRCTDRAVTPVSVAGVVNNRTSLPVNPTAVGFNLNKGAINQTTGAYAVETPPSTHDLLALHTGVTGVGTDVIVDAAVVQRGVTAPQSTQAVDWSTNAATQSFVVTINGGGANHLTATTLYTAGGTVAELAVKSATPYEARSLAVAQMNAADVYEVAAFYASTGARETATTAVATVAATTFTQPAALGGALATVPTATPYPEVKTTWSAYPNAIGYSWDATQSQTPTQCGGAAQCAVAWSAIVSPGAVGASPAYQMPDLSALAGWSAGFQIVVGTAVTGHVSAVTSNAGATDFPIGIPAVGTQRTFARADYTVTP